MPNTSTFLWLFFSLSGRVNRAAYLLAFLLATMVPAFFLYRFMLTPQDSALGQTWAFVFWVTFAISIWSNLALSVKRLHDLAQPGIFALALFIPVVSIVAFVLLCFYPGTPGPNKFGKNTNAPA